MARGHQIQSQNMFEHFQAYTAEMQATFFQPLKWLIQKQITRKKDKLHRKQDVTADI